MKSINRFVVVLLSMLAIAFAGFTLTGCSDLTDYLEGSVTGQDSDVVSTDNSSSYETGSHTANTVEYYFRNSRLLNEHYNKHGRSMGFASAEEYEQAASDVVNNPNALHKLESEDYDDVYYVESTNDFVIVSTDGYIRTYFRPDSGISYYNRQ